MLNVPNASKHIIVQSVAKKMIGLNIKMHVRPIIIKHNAHAPYLTHPKHTPQAQVEPDMGHDTDPK